MTKFEKIVEGGPELLAKILVESKIYFAEGALKAAGLEYKVSDETRNELFRLHYEILISEYKEKGSNSNEI